MCASVLSIKRIPFILGDYSQLILLENRALGLRLQVLLADIDRLALELKVTQQISAELSQRISYLEEQSKISDESYSSTIYLIRQRNISTLHQFNSMRADYILSLKEANSLACRLAESMRTVKQLQAINIDLSDQVKYFSVLSGKYSKLQKQLDQPLVVFYFLCKAIKSIMYRGFRNLF